MNATKIQVFLAEFPWLKNHMSAQMIADCAEVKVERIDLDLCKRGVHVQISGYGYFEFEQRESIGLLDKNGHCIAVVGEIRYPAKPKTWYQWNPRPYIVRNNDETVEGALCRIGDKIGEVHFILCVGWEWSNSLQRYVHPVTIAKPPKSFTLKGWIEKIKQETKEQLKQEIAKVDEVVTNQ